MSISMQLRAAPSCTLHAASARPGLRRTRAPFSSSRYLGKRLVISRPLGVPAPRRSAAAVQPAQASILGVGAPEAILVGVVALLVFGPKGLAQAAKGLGQTLRAFQPTIRELTQVSAELKSTLEQEIGLDEIRSEFSRPAVPEPRPATPAAAAAAGASTSGEELGLTKLAEEMQTGLRAIKEDAASAIDPDIARKRAEAAALAWGTPPQPAAAASSSGDGAAPVPAAAPRSLNSMSIEELEAELAARRRAAAGGRVPPTLGTED